MLGEIYKAKFKPRCDMCRGRLRRVVIQVRECQKLHAKNFKSATNKEGRGGEGGRVEWKAFISISVLFGLDCTGLVAEAILIGQLAVKLNELLR